MKKSQKLSLKIKSPKKRQNSKLQIQAPYSTKHSRPRLNHTQNTPKFKVPAKVSHRKKSANPPLVPALPLSNLPSGKKAKIKSSTRQKSQRLQTDDLTGKKLQFSIPASSFRQATAKRTSSLDKFKDKKLLQQASAAKQSKPPITKRALNFKHPLTAGEVLQSYKENLTQFEQEQIISFDEIYYIGDIGKKTQTSLMQDNFGYDNERGDYLVKKGDHLLYRYEILSILGSGSFGQVFRVLDHKFKEEIALKIIRNKRKFHQQAQVQIRILQHLKQNDFQEKFSVIHIKQHFLFRQHICITFELFSMNLYQLLKKNNFRGLSMSLIKRIANQILKSLCLHQNCGIIHCDLKPENILLKQSHKSTIKVIDYGSACFKNQKIYTYIQSRFYRAPEIMLGVPYSTAIDIWSFGCILVQLYTGFPLFPGQSQAQQFSCIMEVLGVPPSDLMALATRKKFFFNQFDQPNILVNSRGHKRVPYARSLQDILTLADPHFSNLIQKCLEWDPNKRILASQALKHPWIQNQSLKTMVKIKARTGSLQPHQRKPSHKQAQKCSFGNEMAICNPNIISRKIKQDHFYIQNLSIFTNEQ